MGIKQSVYEKPGTLNYYKFSAEEYVLVKKVWSGIEINPQFHGNACLRSFCETYPQYTKFFTQESKLHLTLDTRITAKFSIIMETMGYLLLDFNKKPKQLDRLVGYIAMVHKDMRLDEQDMHNFATSVFQYLSRTYPTQMTAQCQRAMSKFMDSVIKELCVKMKLFRDYDVAQSEVAARSKLPWERCPLFAEAPIFGKTKLYWDEWKKQWNARLDEWAVQTAAQEQVSVESISNDTRNDEDTDEIPGTLQRKVSELIREQHDSEMSTARLALFSSIRKVKASAQPQPNRTPKRIDKRHQRRISVLLPDEHPEAARASRARYRAKIFTDDSRPQVDTTILSTNSSTLGETVSKIRDKEMIEQERESFEIATVKPQNIARKRRRERFNVDLK